VKIVVVGGTGLIGTRLVRELNRQGQEAVTASRATGVNTVTREGLDEVLEGADVVVDVTNSSAYDGPAVFEFFEPSTRHLLSAGALAGIKHHVGLSVVGTDRLGESGYFSAKIVQEELIRNSGLPYTLVHATQFFEFVETITEAAADEDEENTVHLPPARIQPMAADDVAAAVAGVAQSEPRNGTVEFAGPDEFRLDELARKGLAARHDRRVVMTEPDARYFGAILEEDTLVPGPDAVLSPVHFTDWLERP